jgi:nitrate reductase delta subunit
MHVLYTVSRLLDYPDAQLQVDAPELLELVDDSPLSIASKQRLHSFLRQRLSQPLMDWQSDYDALFERGRSVSLWLFEHVHGESRDRGQAMVDLLAEYRKAGLEIGQKELPDFLPLFLEFLATQGQENARAWLSEVETILATLLCRLEQRDSNYADLFHALLEVAGNNVNLVGMRAKLADEKRDDTREAMDKAWEEEMVTFGAGDAHASACSSSSASAKAPARPADNYVPVTWVDFNDRRTEPRR